MAESAKKPRAAKSKTKNVTETKPGEASTQKTPGSAQPTPISASGPTHEQIAELARKYWAQRGYADGHHEEDWFRAERELHAKAS
ncbi:MAG TPA: DUF2934 domain-containing protein [Acidobacteriaceae bacterium]|nr:DUF2934 domain-containing protein [Acidobacteriaceae bacterium]